MDTKRLKSGLITLVSIIAAVMTTPAWASFVVLANTKLLGWGIPTVITTLLGVIIAEVWKYILNQQTLAQAERMGTFTSRADLY